MADLKGSIINIHDATKFYRPSRTSNKYFSVDFKEMRCDQSLISDTIDDGSTDHYHSKDMKN